MFCIFVFVFPKVKTLNKHWFLQWCWAFSFSFDPFMMPPRPLLVTKWFFSFAKGFQKTSKKSPEIPKSAQSLQKPSFFFIVLKPPKKQTWNRGLQKGPYFTHPGDFQKLRSPPRGVWEASWRGQKQISRSQEAWEPAKNNVSFMFCRFQKIEQITYWAPKNEPSWRP